jgi:hypothetical protein
VPPNLWGKRLDVSEFLIVLCSPAAVGSKYVDEEIRYFRNRGRDDRILAFVVDVAPGKSVSSSFPPALIEGAPSGRESGLGHEPLAPDARACGDGWKDAHVKLVAGMLGLPLDFIKGRHARRQTKKRLAQGAAAVSLVVAAAITIASVLQTRDANRAANAGMEVAVQGVAESRERIARLTDSMQMRASAAVESLLANLDQLSKLRMWGVGNPKTLLERATNQLRLAREYGRRADYENQRRAAMQGLAEIAELKAEGELERSILMLRAEGHWLLGNAYFGASKWEVALGQYEQGETILFGKVSADFFYESDAPISKLGPDEYVAWTRLMLGKVGALARLGRKEEGLATAKRCIRMGRGLSADNREAGQLLVQAHYMAADLLRQINAQQSKGNEKGVREAEAHLTEGLERALSLRDSLPERQWRRGVSNQYLGRGDWRRSQGKHMEALADYENARSHREVLAAADPSDLVLKAEFAFSLIKVGEEINTLRRHGLQSRDADAVKTFEIAIGIYADLRQQRPQDLRARHWEWTTHQGLAEAHRLAKDPDEEMHYHATKLALAGKNYLYAPDSVDFLLDLAESYRDYGDAFVARGKVQLGMKHLSDARELLAQHVEGPQADPRSLHLQGRVLESIARANAAPQSFADAP